MASKTPEKKSDLEFPMIEIVQQPKATGLQFVKPGQMPSMGSYIMGETMTYPSILVMNYEVPTKLVWYLVSDDALHPHPYILEGEDCKDGVCTKNIEECEQIISFPRLYVRSVPREDMLINVVRRINILKKHLPGTEFIRKDPTEYNQNTARICFSVLLLEHEDMVKSVLTRWLHRKNPILHRGLCILSVSQCKGLVHGGEEMSLQVTTLKTDDVFVFFHHESQAPRTSWQAFADVVNIYCKKGQPTNIVIRTPAFHNQKITEPQTVAVQVRLIDNSFSNTVKFTYSPQAKGPSKIEQKAKQKEPVYVKYFKCLEALVPLDQEVQLSGADDGASSHDRDKHPPMIVIQHKPSQQIRDRTRKPKKVNVGCQTKESMELLEGCDSEEELCMHEERVDYDRVYWYRSLWMEPQSSQQSKNSTEVKLDDTSRQSEKHVTDFSPRGILGSFESNRANKSRSSETDSKNSILHDSSSQGSSEKWSFHEGNQQAESSKSDWPLNSNDGLAKTDELCDHQDQEMDFDCDKQGQSLAMGEKMDVMNQEKSNTESPVLSENVETLDDVSHQDQGFSSSLSTPEYQDHQTHSASDEISSTSISPDSGIYVRVTSSKMSTKLSTVHEMNSSIGKEEDCLCDSDRELDETRMPDSSGKEKGQTTTSTNSENAAEGEADKTKAMSDSHEGEKRADDEFKDSKEQDGDQSGDGRGAVGLGSYLSPPKATKRVDHKGGRLEILNGEISLDIPPGALKEGQVEDITLTVDWDDGHIPPLNKTDMNVAPIVHCGPTGLKLEKPVILQIPHCAVVPDRKKLQMVVHCSQTDEGTLPQWEKVPLTDNPEVDVECGDHCFILRVTHFTGYTCTVPLPGGTTTSAKEVMVLAYGQEIKNFVEDQEIRVYIYDFHGSSRELIHQEEKHLSGKQLDGPSSYQFHELHQGKFTVEAEFSTPGWLLKSSSPKVEISFSKIWNIQSWDRCKFTWSNGSEVTEFRCRFRVKQEKNQEKATLEISNHVKIMPELSQPKPQPRCERHTADAPVYEQFNYERKTYTRGISTWSGTDISSMAGTNSANMSAVALQFSDSGCTSNVLIPYDLEQTLCHLLDPEDLAMGNDWRRFGAHFGFDEHINRWKNHPSSPTANVLNAIQQERKIHTLNDLRESFIKINRLDAAEAVEQCEIKQTARTTPSIQPSDSEPMSETPSPDDFNRPLTGMEWSSNQEDLPQPGTPWNNWGSLEPQTDLNRNIDGNEQCVNRALFN